LKKMKVLAVLAFVLNTFLFGSYYSVGKEMLGRVDPIVFTFFTMMTLVPPAICILAFSWRHLTRAAIKSGFLLGSCLCLGLFTLAVALKYNSATGTAFFPSINGLLAAICTWLFLRQPLNKATWFAGVVSVIGAVLLMANSSMGGARGALIAFIGGLLCTFYIFLADHEQKDPAVYWPLFGVELLTMAIWANLIALLFGDWSFVHFTLPGDAGVVLYVGLGTIFLPTLITVLLQKYVSPVTVSFISIMEPIFGALVAFFYLHEVLPLDGYIGGALIVGGVLIHTWGTIERPAQRQLVVYQSTLNSQQLQTSWFQVFVTPMLCCIIGACFVFKLGGFPPPVWQDLYQAWPQLFPMLQGGQRMEAILMLGQSSCWFIAWLAIASLGGLVFYRVCNKLFTTSALAVDLDMRTLRQMGYTQHQYAIPAHVGYATRKLTYDELDEENALEQQRRLHRRVRLAHIEPADDEIYEAPTHVPNRHATVTQKHVYRGAPEKHWQWGNDNGAMEARKP
jgi:drug/metabolite transporter (DMT)-like permease